MRPYIEIDIATQPIEDAGAIVAHFDGRRGIFQIIVSEKELKFKVWEYGKSSLNKTLPLYDLSNPEKPPSPLELNPLLHELVRSRLHDETPVGYHGRLHMDDFDYTTEMGARIKSITLDETPYLPRSWLRAVR